MTILHMESDEVRRAADQFYHLTTEIDENLGRLQRTLANLESAWRGPSANSFSSRLDSTLRRLNALSDEGAVLARRLSAEVAEWEQAAAHLDFTYHWILPVKDIPSLIGLLPISPPWNLFPWPFPGMFFPLPFREGFIPPDGSATGGPYWAGEGGFEGGFSGGGGGGGGGGAWGSDDPPKSDIDTEYFLIRGYQIELMERYRVGDMTWDEMVGHLEEMEKSTNPDYFDGKVTVFEKKWEGGDSVAWRERQISGEYGTIDASVGRATGEWDGSIRYGEEGLEGKLEGTAGLYAIHGEASGQLAGYDMAGQAFLGAEVTGDVNARVDPAAGALLVGAGVNAFAGAKAEGSVNKNIAKGVDVGAKGALMAGAGVILEGEAGFEDNVLKVDYDVGAAWGIGAEVGFEFELNVIDAGQEVARIGQDAIYSIF